jgi:DNA-binding transcriptional ArsR family regulator
MTENLLRETPLMQSAYDRFLTTLKNKVRLAIVQALTEKSKNVSELTRELAIHQTTVSHGLKKLLDCGFVFVEQRGKERVYSVNGKTIRPLIKLMNDHVSNYCAKVDCKKCKE